MRTVSNRVTKISTTPPRCIVNLADMVFQLVLPWERAVAHSLTAITFGHLTPKYRWLLSMSTVIMPFEIVPATELSSEAFRQITLDDKVAEVSFVYGCNT